MDEYGNVAGKKPRWAREVDADNWQDLLGLSAAEAAKFQSMSAKAVVDDDGNKLIIYDAVYTSDVAIAVEDYGGMGIGSTILNAGAATKTIYYRCAKSEPAVAGDWYKEDLTQET